MQTNFLLYGIPYVDANDIKALKYLIKNGAKANIQDCDGCSPLHKAVLDGKREFCKVLLEYGANINLPDKISKTPLDYDYTHKNNLILTPILKGKERNQAIALGSLSIIITTAIIVPAIIFLYLLYNSSCSYVFWSA
ncbi:ankyrin repeat domain-containing protein [Wolbachia endosymbiont of Pentidionis agamae]|uniref:ankyrin repeat domain-containing protein n=1 Tax=Wolbachia endosymbiont of Pentidionis agamae TaxID=3110435 RepID=UPI0038CD14F6